MEYGLNLVRNYSSINGNVFAIGVVKENNDSINEYLENYIWGDGQQTNVIVMYPPIIQNSNGEQMYLGYTYNLVKYSQDQPRSLMDIVCSNLGYILKGFIMGYYIDTQNRYGKKVPGEHITYDFEELVIYRM